MDDHTDSSWRDLSQCRGLDSEFFTDNLEAALRTDWALAREVCRSCQVQTQCLEEGVAIGDVWMYRAGTTPLQRLALIAPDYRPNTDNEAHARRLRRRMLDRMRAKRPADEEIEAQPVRRAS